MGLFNNFPWTNMHELNLQWIVETLKKCYSPDNPPETMVISVNGQSGVVTLYPEAVIRFPDVQDTQWNMWRNTDGVSTGIQFEKGQPAKRIDGQSRIVIYDANNPPPYPVVSVNGETGEIELYTEAYVEFPDITENNWGIQRKLNTGEANETQVGIMFDDTGKAKIIKDEDSNDLYSENNPPPYPVNSVDGNTGNVITWANHATEILKMPLSSNTDNWAISRDITHGNLSIKLMYDDNIQECTAYMVYNDGVNTPTTIKLLTLDDIPTSSGVVSINGNTGVVILNGANIPSDANSTITIDQKIENIKQSIAITENGNLATHNIPKDSYVLWLNSAYIAKTNISIGDTLSSTNLESITNGFINKTVESAIKQVTIYDNRVSFVSQDPPIVERTGNICVLTGECTFLIAPTSAQTSIIYLPSDCIPKRNTWSVAYRQSDGKVFPLQVSTTGNLNIINQEMIQIGDTFDLSITYIV